MELCNIPAKSLDKFIEEHLLPDTPFRLQVRQAINMICSFLKEKCFQSASHPVRVSKVVKVSQPACLGRGRLNGQGFAQRTREQKVEAFGDGGF